MYAVGIDIGGTWTKFGRIDQTGKVLESGRESTPRQSPQALVEAIVSIVRRFQDGSKPVAIGLGIPGLISRETGVVELSPNLPCLNGFNVQRALAGATSFPLVSRNDAEMSAWGEFSLGAGVGASNLACLTLGTGIGAGLILNGLLYTGPLGFAGEVGHITVDPDGMACPCGSRGCLETVASAAAIVHLAASKLEADPSALLRGTEEPLTPALLHAAAERGDRVSREVLAEAGRWLGIACATLINLLNLELIVVGGGVAAAGEFLLHDVRAEARSRSYKQTFDACRIVPATLGNDAGIIGAGLLAINAFRRS